MFDLIAGILAWIYELVNNLGISIVLLTLLVMVVMTPLPLSGTKSMIKMQRLQPELRKIQQKHKNDREKMNAEMMAFYQEHGVNPVGGCLPLFFQMPVFLVLYRVISGLTRRQVLIGVPVGAANEPASGEALRVASSDELGVTRNFNPQYLDDSTQLFQDLSNQSEIPFFFDFFDLSLSPLDALRDSVVTGIPYLLLLVLVLVSSLYQQRQIQGRNPNAMANPQQAALMKIMPWFLPVISFSLQTALVLYFVVSNLYRIGQQAYITRSLYGDGHSEVIDVESTPTKKKGGAKNTPATTDKTKKKSGDNNGATGGRASSDKAKKKPSNNKPAKQGKSQSSSQSSSSKSKAARRGAGAGRPEPRNNPTPSSRTGGGQPRPAKNRKKKK
ncbi:MAG: YidC/Oxa1 family membrane protein insertase [Acidimicrobiales bacterium]